MASGTLVLIVNWNGKAITLDCLRSLVDAGVREEDVLVVDNGSTDGSREAIAASHPRVRQLPLATNLGFASGCNAGLRLALAEGRYEHALLLNNDTLVTPGMLAALEHRLAADPRAAAVQPKIAFFDRKTIEDAGYECDRYGVTFPRGRGEDAATSFPDEGVFYLTGACLLVRLDALRAVGVFDDAYFCYHEDVDLNWRLRLAGWRLLYEDGALCYHNESTTAGKTPRTMGLIWRNRYRTLLKNYGAARAWRRVPAAMMLTMASSLVAGALQREWRLPWLHLKAVLWNVAHLRGTLRDRRAVQALRRVGDRELEAAFTRDLIEVRMARARRARRRSPTPGASAGTRAPPRTPRG